MLFRKTNIAELLLLVLLSVFTVELVTLDVLLEIRTHLEWAETPMDCEGEEEKSESEKENESVDKILFTSTTNNIYDFITSIHFEMIHHYSSGLQEIFTPPPECRV